MNLNKYLKYYLKNNFFFSLIFIILFYFPSQIKSQILTFDFVGITGSEASVGSNFNHVNLSASTITRGAGLTASANGDRFNATSWALTSIANAVSGNDYMEFTISPQTGYKFTISSIVIQLQRSATGPSQIALRSSLDSYGSNLDAVKTVVDNTSTQSFTFTFAQTPACDVAVTYRLYSYAEAAAGTGGPGDGAGNDIVVNGTVSSCGSNSITTGAVTDAPFDITCTTNDAGSVAFTSSGVFTAGNIYTAQLSDAAGAFGSPLEIGTLSSTSNSGNINITIPGGLPASANYRIRVISSSPFVVGSLSSVFTINLSGGPCTPKKPFINSVILNGCDGACTEGRTEIVFANSGGLSINTSVASNVNLNYTSNGAQNMLLFFKDGSAKTTALNAAAACPGTFVDGRNTVIPPNSKMMFVSEAFCPASYNTWSNYCGTGPIYVLYGQDGVSSTIDGWVTGGNFGNSSAPNFDLVVTATDASTYRTRYNYSLANSGQGDGNYVVYNINYGFQDAEYPTEVTYRTPVSDGVLPACEIILLPITWGGIKAIVKDGVLIVNWSTISEKNNNYFEILLSDETGLDFKTIGMVKGAGTSSDENFYSFHYNDLAKGQNYVRLKQIDYDGRASFSEIKSVKNNEGNLEIIKTKNNQLVLSDELKRGTSVDFYDITGKQLSSVIISERTEKIEIPSLAKGLVILKIENEYQGIDIFKLILE